MGCGALLLSDAGRYPEGMEDGRTLAAYRSENEMVALIEQLLADGARRQSIARAGHAMISERYSKERQWRDFMELVA
jgi:spore maturation protein CgeB